MHFLREPYRDDPLWVYPDVRILKKLFRGRACFCRQGRWAAFLAEDAGQTVAAVTAFVHPSFEERYGERIATLGFFEALPAREVAGLFSHAEGWLAAQGVHKIWVPLNGHMMYGFGCLAQPGADLPVIGTAYNPPYYHRYFLQSGFAVARTFLSYTIDLRRQETGGAVVQSLGNIAHDIKIRAASLLRFRRDVRHFVDIHNISFAQNWGDTPLTYEEGWELMGPVVMMGRRDLFLFAEMDGTPIAAIFASPDYNAVLAGVGCPPASIRGALALLTKRHRLDRAGIYVVGVLPQARGRGIATALTAMLLEKMSRDGFNRAEYILVDKENLPSRRIAESFGGRVTKEYVVYEKRLTTDRQRDEVAETGK